MTNRKAITPFPGQTLAALLLLSTFFGCDDPSSVGLELIGGSNGEPKSFVVEPSLLSEENGRDITGSRTRVLVGSVADPITGEIGAAGLLDFGPGSSRTESFLSGPLTSATLTLTRDYVYGDTLQAGTLTLSMIAEEWEQLGLPSDTSVTSSGVIGTVNFSPADSIVTFEFPPDWIAANDTTFRSSTFSTSFHGIKLEATGVNSIVGFTTASLLSAVSGGDTTSFVVQMTGTTTTRSSDASLPAERILIQDSAGPQIGIDFELNSDTLSDAVLNRFEITLVADTALVSANLPSGFARPVPASFDLIGVTEDDALVFIDSGTIDDDGKLSFTSTPLSNIYRDRLRSGSTIDHLRIVPGSSDIGVGPMVFHAESSSAQSPKATVVVSQFQK